MAQNNATSHLFLCVCVCVESRGPKNGGQKGHPPKNAHTHTHSACHFSSGGRERASSNHDPMPTSPLRLPSSDAQSGGKIALSAKQLNKKATWHMQGAFQSRHAAKWSAKACISLFERTCTYQSLTCTASTSKQARKAMPTYLNKDGTLVMRRFR